MRDLTKDKDTLKLLMKKEGRLDPIFIAQHWIAQYEAAQAENATLKKEIDQLKAEKFAPRPLGWW